MGAAAVGFLGFVVRPWHGSLPWERKDRTNVRKADLPKTRSKKQGVTGSSPLVCIPNTTAYTTSLARGFLSILSSFLGCCCAVDLPQTVPDLACLILLCLLGPFSAHGDALPRFAYHFYSFNLCTFLSLLLNIKEQELPL